MKQVAPSPSVRLAEADLSGHIPALDGVRGLAIALVLLNNLYPGYPHGFVDRLFYIASNAGWVGVDLFFVLSGFLITGILWDTRDDERYFTSFYVRRILRIFPLYYGFLLLWSLAAPALFPDPAGLQSWHESRIWYWTYLSNVHIALHGEGQLEPGHFWSLAVEEQFYLLWPLVVLLSGRRRLIAVCFAMLAAALLFRLGWRLHDSSPQVREALYVLTPARMDALAMGALIAVTARSAGGLERLVRWSRLAFPTALAVLLAIFVARKGFLAGDPLVQTVGYTVVAAAAGAGLVLALAAPPGGRTHAWITHPVLLVLGRYSYGIYVWHVVSRATWLLPFVREPPTLLGHEFPVAIAMWLVLSGAAVLIAVLSFHLVERPILRLKERFPYQRRRLRPPKLG